MKNKNKLIERLKNKIEKSGNLSDKIKALRIFTAENNLTYEETIEIYRIIGSKR